MRESVPVESRSTLPASGALLYLAERPTPIEKPPPTLAASRASALSRAPVTEIATRSTWSAA